MLCIMKFSALLCALLSIASVSAKVFNVNVGDNSELVFNPPCVSGAVAGDQIVFKFVSKNHTVTQSTFGTPCTRQSATAFDSGFMPANASSQPTFTVTLDEQTASVPLWFYCKQKNPVSHCNKGMVFAVNPTATKTFAQFKENAINQPANATSGTPCTTSTPSATGGPSTSGSSGSTGSTGSTNSTGTVHSILVGENNTLTFSPPSIQAVAGDTIKFTFLSKNHSATQSTFTNPCALAPGGVDSGFQPVSANSSKTMQWSITLDAKSASSPLWFFCAQTNPAVHCHAGMVFAINANANKTFDQYKANAMNAGGSNSSSNSTSSGGSSGSSSGGSPDSSSASPSGAGSSYGATLGSSNSGAGLSSPTTTAASAGASSVNVNAASNGVPRLHASANIVVSVIVVALVASFNL